MSWQWLTDHASQPGAPDGLRPYALQIADRLGDLLALERFDRSLLELVVASDRLPRVATLVALAGSHGHDLPTLFGELAGAERNDAVRSVRLSPVFRLGLANFIPNRAGSMELDLSWTLERLLDRTPADSEEIVDVLVGSRQAACLELSDFAHVQDLDFLVRLISGSVKQGVAGINILIHGPPGTGKTELARSLAAAAAVQLHAVGEADCDGEEPSRWDRVNALKLAQRVLVRRGGAALLFDEMEDLIGDARPSGGDWLAKRNGSKIFVNRLLETNEVPVLWTSNAIGNVDPAIIRRMSFVLHLDLPPRSVGRHMLDRIASEELVTPGAHFEKLLDLAPETASVLRVAARAGRIAADADGGARSAEALVRALRGGELPLGGPGEVDLDFYETDLPLAPLLDHIATGEHTDVSLLLAGPPGTGKTALAHHFARTLDRPLIVRRASDLLSKWVGETEAQIAQAFGEARREGGVLLFDEVDSLLFDRSTARTSWEVSQVNELLSWLDHHPLPVVAATNHVHKLDPATLRRFVFKIDLQTLSAPRAAAAFERFFGRAAPTDLAAVSNLTPGDFAVVARQLRHAPTTNTLSILQRLKAEAEAKPCSNGRIGF